MRLNHVLPPLALLAAAFPLSQPALAGDSGYVAHEWGTFTSLQDSEGHSADGMYHEDEELPAFVHGRAELERPAPIPEPAPDPIPVPTFAPQPHPCHGKACDFNPVADTAMGVTQKMETPVIYFYSDRDRDVQVNVDFPGGIITQYYPNVTDYGPPIGAVDAVANGHVRWDVRVTRDALQIPYVTSDNIWAPSRQVPAASFVSAQGENEKLIFYRGLGRFDTPLSVPSVGNSAQARNGSDQRVPDVFVLNVSEYGGMIYSHGSIAPHGTLDIPSLELAQPKQAPMETYVELASTLVADALVRSGLYRDEALAMVNTWKKSYFRTPGVRVLYVLPREWTDQLLPIRISPQPRELVRTLVGRIELLTSGAEQGLLTRLEQEQARGSDGSAVLQDLGRFAEPKLRRIAQIAQGAPYSDAFRTFVGGLVERSAH